MMAYRYMRQHVPTPAYACIASPHDASWVFANDVEAFTACVPWLLGQRDVKLVVVLFAMNEDGMLDALVNVASNISSLKLLPPAPATCDDGTLQHMLCTLVSRCTNLKHFDISGTNGEVGDAVVLALADAAPGLIELNASYCDGKVTDTSMQQIAMKCKQLEYVAVGANNSQITDASIHLLASHARGLRHLSVRATGGTVRYASIVQILRQCDSLGTLDICFTSIAAGLLLLALGQQNRPTPLTLRIAAGDATETDIHWSNTNVVNVVNVVSTHACSLGGCVVVANDILSTAGPPSMRVVLVLEALRSVALRQLLQVLGPFISTLKLLPPAPATCGHKKIQHRLCTLVNRCTNLKRFDISGTNGEVRDPVVLRVARSCSGLVELNVSYCDGRVTDKSMKEIARWCPQLECVAVGANNKKITDASINLLARHARSLRHLSVRATGGAVTDASIVQILRQCVNLEVLDTRDTYINAATPRAQLPAM